MRMLILSLTVLSAAVASGKASNEYYFQPAAGASALELSYQALNAKPEDAGVETELTGTDTYINYAYGLNDYAALGVYTFTGTLESKTSGVTTKQDGMGDLQLYYKGFSDVWHYGVDYGLNTEKSKADNRSTGGPSIRLNGGGLWTDGSWNYGGDLAYTFKMERTNDSTPATKTTEGNETRIAAFGEYNYGSGFVGGELSSTTEADSKEKTSGVTTTVSGDEFTALKVYASYAFNETVDGLFSFENQMHAKDGTVDAFTVTLLTAGVRLNF